MHDQTLSISIINLYLVIDAYFARVLSPSSAAATRIYLIAHPLVPRWQQRCQPPLPPLSLRSALSRTKKRSPPIHANILLFSFVHSFMYKTAAQAGHYSTLFLSLYFMGRRVRNRGRKTERGPGSDRISRLEHGFGVVYRTVSRTF